MTLYRYRGFKADGTSATGTLEGKNPSDVVRSLASGGLVITDIIIDSRPAKIRKVRRVRLSSEEIVTLTREWATLLSAGLKVDEALAVCLSAGKRKAAHNALERIRRSVRDGRTFHGAIGEVGLLPREALALIEAGETAGALPKVLERLADELAQRRTTEEGLTTALLYPAVLLVTTCAALAVIVLVVAPNLAELFQGVNNHAPPQVTALLNFAAFIRFAAPFTAAALLLFIVGLFFMHRNASGRRILHSFVLKAPLLGSILRSRDSARFAAAAALMMDCGVIPTKALPLASAVISNSAMREAIDSALSDAARGTALHDALSKVKSLPIDLLALIGVGLRTGRLADVLRHGGILHAARAHSRIERFSALLTPAITILAGVVVGGLAYLVLTAVTSLNEVAYQ